MKSKFDTSDGHTIDDGTPGPWHGLATSEPHILIARGQRIYLQLPWVNALELRSIANSLANLCRWTGHTYPYYSVAAHSIHVSDIMRRTHGIDGARLGLMHDAHEAITGDVANPVKRVLGTAWETFEKSWQSRTRTGFGIEADEGMLKALRHADAIALSTEHQEVMTPDDEFSESLPTPDSRGPRGLGPTNDAQLFLHVAHELGIPAVAPAVIDWGSP